MRKFIALFKAHPVLTPAFMLAATLTLLFAIRTIAFTIYWADPAHRDRAIEPWMTPRYVAQSWDLPPEEVAGALGIASGSARRVSMAEIAAQTGLSLEEIEARIRAAALARRQQDKSGQGE